MGRIPRRGKSPRFLPNTGGTRTDIFDMRNLLWILGLAVLPLVGCAHQQPYVTSERLERGLVVVLPGIEGRSVFNENICRGLDDGGVNYAIELVDWTSGLGPLYNLRAEQRNREQARRIAEMVVRYRMGYPGRPVLLVGQSGGGAMAVWIAEALPPGQQVEGLILLAATLSPEYPLDDALAKSRLGILSSSSDRDWVFLVLGTAAAGTMDGEHSASAGNSGFVVPDKGPRAKLYHDKLHQIHWTPQMADTGNWGMHLTSGTARFVSLYVAPFVLSDTWSDAVTDKILRRQRVATRDEPPAPAVH